jgi:hypothetical protein
MASFFKWLTQLNATQLVAGITGIGSVTYAIIKFINKFSPTHHIRRILNIEPGADDLRAAMDNMSQVVLSQGQSIDWLTNQLVQYRTELDDNHEKLKDMETMHKENLALKRRVTELEDIVRYLEKELERRKKYTPKAYLKKEDIESITTGGIDDVSTNQG